MLGVHEHLVPTDQLDCFVIAMAYSSAGEHLRVADHALGTLLSVLRKPAELRFRKAIRVIVAHVYRRPATPIELLAPVWFAPSAPNGLVVQNELRIRNEIRLRDKEPFALTQACLGAPATARLPAHGTAALVSEHLGGLEGLLSGLDARYTAGRLGNRRDKPRSLIVAAQELELLIVVAGEKQQVSQGRGYRDDAQPHGGTRNEVEVLAVPRSGE